MSSFSLISSFVFFFFFLFFFFPCCRHCSRTSPCSSPDDDCKSGLTFPNAALGGGRTGDEGLGGGRTGDEGLSPWGPIRYLTASTGDLERWREDEGTGCCICSLLLLDETCTPVLYSWKTAFDSSLKNETFHFLNFSVKLWRHIMWPIYLKNDVKARVNSYV